MRDGDSGLTEAAGEAANGDSKGEMGQVQKIL